MKFIFALFIYISLSFSQELTLTRIQVKGNTHTSEDLIKQFLFAKEHDKYTLNDLKDRAKRSETILTNTFYFFSNKVVVVPLSKTKAKLLVRIQEGFLYRFGGSQHGVFVGKDNVFGNGTSLGAALGPSTALLQYSKVYVANTPFHLSASASTGSTSTLVPEKGEFSDSYTQKSAKAQIGWSPRPDMNISVFTEYLNTDFKHENHTKENLFYGVTAVYSYLDNYIFPQDGYKLSAYSKFYDSNEYYVGKLSFYTPLFKSSFIGKFRLSAGHTSKTADIAHTFNLAHYDGLTTQKATEASSTNALLFEAKVSHKLMDFAFFGSALHMNTFYQFGQLSDTFKFEDPTHVTGLGLTYYLPYPVNVKVETRYGFSEDGNRFTFTIRSDLGSLGLL